MTIRSRCGWRIEAAVKCARWRLFQPGADEKTQTTLVNDLMARRDKQKARANIINPNPSAFKTAILPERCGPTMSGSGMTLRDLSDVKITLPITDKTALIFDANTASLARGCSQPR